MQMGLSATKPAPEDQEMAVPRVKLPGFGLPLDEMPPWLSTEDEFQRFPHAIVDFFAIPGITQRERRMRDFVNQITDKHHWYDKVNDPNIVAKWKDEACGTTEDWVHDAKLLSPTCFEYCMAELKDKARYYKDHGVIHILECKATIVKKDLDESDKFCVDLNEAVKPLENVPEHCKDWHPFSNGLVLDLIHPSLHPLKYGLTRVLTTGKVGLSNCAEFTGKGEIIPIPTVVSGEEILNKDQSWGHSAKLKAWGSYQWLPTDITFDDSGKAQIDSYINNLHPRYNHDLYSVLAGAVDKAVPLWEECLSWWHDRLCIEISGCGFHDFIMPEDFAREKAQLEAAKNEHKAAEKAARAQRKEDPASERGAMAKNVGLSGGNQGPNKAHDADEAVIPGAKDGNTDHGTASGQEDTEARDENMMDESDDSSGGSDTQTNETDAGIGENDQESNRDDVSVTTNEADRDNEYDWEDRYSDWLYDNPELRKIRQPEPRGKYMPFKESIEAQKQSRLNLRGSKFPHGLQVIFKLASIHLTPEQPAYDGSSWHVEGALNEHICATALFYYDQENIEDSYLAFRHQVDAEEMVGKPQQSEYVACEDLFGIEQEAAAVQPIGQVLTRPGRAIAFPNVMQHCVRDFKLKDPTLPGHRKILAMFLVDPHIRIISTSNVPPQQIDWWGEEISKVDAFAKLPVEMVDRILAQVQGFPIPRNDALDMREELMEERGAQNDSYEAALQEDTFFFCEH